MNGSQQRLTGNDRIAALLDDPIVQMMMYRDGVSREDIYAVVTEARRRLNSQRSLLETTLN